MKFVVYREKLQQHAKAATKIYYIFTSTQLKIMLHNMNIWADLMKKD